MKALLAESEDFSPEALQILKRKMQVVAANLDRSGLIGALSDVEVLWVRLRTQIDAQVLNAAPRLRAIVTNTTGLNHIDLAEAERRGIAVLSLRGEVDFLRSVRATAEHTIGLILALTRHIPSAATHVKSGGWDRNLFKGRDLYGKTAGIIGFGRLGSIVAGYLHALGMHVLATTRPPLPENVPPHVTLTDLEHVLRRSDVVTLHVNLTRENQTFFGRDEFELVKRDAYFINTSRGELIDESALLDALRRKRIAGAALDVLNSEHSIAASTNPLIDYARSHDNLLITPHIGGYTCESLENTEIFMANKLIAYAQSPNEPGRETAA